jgi:tripartite-type tricarboxylate transporter receptor subunit TctC
MKKFVLAFAALLAATAPSVAQDWPAKTVKIIAPFGPGSTPDIVARLIADELQKKYPDSNFIVENKAGAGGVIGTDMVAKAAPDGATLGVSIGGPLAINTILMSKLPYDPKKDIAAVTQLVTMPSAVTVNPSLNVNSIAELIALLKKEPGKYNFGSIGNGSLSHLAMEAIGIKSGAQMVHVPYPSSPAATTAIAVTPHAETGKVKILAVTLAQRSPFLPNIPTLKESGIDVEADTWMGLVAPGGTPKPVIDKINSDVADAVKSKAVRDKLAAQLMEPVGNSPEQFRAVIDSEIERWAPIIKAANIQKIN